MLQQYTVGSPLLSRQPQPVLALFVDVVAVVLADVFEQLVTGHPAKSVRVGPRLLEIIVLDCYLVLQDVGRDQADAFGDFHPLGMGRPSELDEIQELGAGEPVLVIDDEPTVRMLIVDILVALLITDVGLPGGLNGRQVADAARELQLGLKVLFITGYAENAAISGGHLDPGMAVMTKPFVMTELANKITEMIDCLRVATRAQRAVIKL